MPSSPGRSAQHGGLGRRIVKEIEVRRTGTNRMVPVLRTSIHIQFIDPGLRAAHYDQG
jgi:hypothetical protein